MLACSDGTRHREPFCNSDVTFKVCLDLPTTNKKKTTRLPYPTVVSHLYMDVHFSTVSLCFIEKYMAVGQQDWQPAFKDQDELYLMRCSTSTYPTEVEH